jgi:hypothetical protein
MFRAIKKGELFITSPENIMRDYLHPDDLYSLLKAILISSPLNASLDAYTKAPVDKFKILSTMRSSFGLTFEIDESLEITKPTGAKKNYYSELVNGVGSKKYC